MKTTDQVTDKLLLFFSNIQLKLVSKLFAKLIYWISYKVINSNLEIYINVLLFNKYFSYIHDGNYIRNNTSTTKW